MLTNINENRSTFLSEFLEPLATPFYLDFTISCTFSNYVLDQLSKFKEAIKIINIDKYNANKYK